MTLTSDLGSPQQLARLAAQWRLLSLLFECPVGNWRAEVSSLMSEVDCPELRTACAMALNQADEALYHSLVAPRGPLPVREVGCSPLIEPGRLLAEVLSYYHAFGYRTDSAEPPDHIAVETGFVGYLLFKRAYALAAGALEMAAIVEQAAATFARDHVAPLAAALSKALAEHGPAYLRLAVAELLRRAHSLAPIGAQG